MKKLQIRRRLAGRLYTWRKAREAGGILKLWKAMRSKNACKTCALGMGGQRGGMVNELGHFPEVCKKSLQAMVADMQGAIRSDFWQQLFAARAAAAFAARAGSLRPAGRAGALHARDRPLHADLLGRRARPHRRRSFARRRPTKRSGTSAAAAATRPASCCSSSPGCTARTTSTIAATIATRPAASAWPASPAAARRRSSWKTWSTPTCVFVIGGNPASNHPRLMRTLMHVRRRGGQVIVINPIVETGLVRFNVPSDVKSLLFGSKIASLYVQPHIGGDLALLTGIAKRIVEMGAHDEAFLNNHCQGWPELQSRLAEVSWDEIIAKSGVARDEIDEIAAPLRRGEERRLQLDDGHHAPRPRRARTCRRSPTSPCCAAWSAGPAAG